MKTIYVQKQAVEVSEAVYKAYWQASERERYQNRLAADRTWTMSDLQAAGVPLDALDAFAVTSSERAFFADQSRSRLMTALATLPPDQEEHLWRLVLSETTERGLAAELGLSPATVHKRKKRALATLRSLLEGEEEDL